MSEVCEYDTPRLRDIRRTRNRRSSARLSGLNFATESFDEVIVDNTIRRGKEGEDGADETAWRGSSASPNREDL